MSTDDHSSGVKKGNQPEGHEQWTVADMANDHALFFDTRQEAERQIEKAEQVPDVEPMLFPPDRSPKFLYHGEPAITNDDGDSDDEFPEAPCGICGDTVSIADAKSGVGGEPIHPECYGGGEPEPVEAEVVERDAGDLPERSVADDPLTWMPGDFVDEIDGTPAINRKGFEVLAHFYDISVSSDLEVPPEDTGHEYCRVKATAETPDGRTCEAYGSAHIDRDDDATLLLEMADTRARKRALSIATGVGAVAVEELKSESKAELEASD